MAGISGIVVGVFQVLATLTASLLVDKVGRRPLLLISQIGIILTDGIFFKYSLKLIS